MLPSCLHRDIAVEVGCKGACSFIFLDREKGRDYEVSEIFTTLRRNGMQMPPDFECMPAYSNVMHFDYLQDGINPSI